MQSLFHETRRLKKDNDVLLIQVSSLDPYCSRQPKSQRLNSKQNEEVSSPRNTKYPSGSQKMRLDEKVLLAHQTLLDESSSSTPTLTKRRRDMRTQLSDAMQAWLGPQIPGMEGRPPHSLVRILLAYHEERCITLYKKKV